MYNYETKQFTAFKYFELIKKKTLAQTTSFVWQNGCCNNVLLPPLPKRKRGITHQLVNGNQKWQN